MRIILLVGVLSIKSAFSQDYDVLYRTQLHYTPEKNWINDPCGMVYLDGEYHLMYQYNPLGNQWGNMSWGHAISRDMVHWEEQEVALWPDDLGYVFSGGAVVDVQNTAGFGDNAIVAIYTSAGQLQEQSIAYSLDNGRVWTKYEANPVLVNQGNPDFRDPMVFWHDATSKWIMAIAAGDQIEFYSSHDLKSWLFLSAFGKEFGSHDGVWECPDLFKVDKYWILIVSSYGGPAGASGCQYFLGEFDGSRFKLIPQFEQAFKQDLEFPHGLLFEDFEKNTYSGWTVTGDAFGPGPAQGTLSNQMPVSGYRGSYLVNTFYDGDGSIGSLTSRKFKLEYSYINFLIGGGNHPDGCTFNLLIDGEKVRTSTGKNSEKLEWENWDVDEFVNDTVQFLIEDTKTAGWGHINLDHIFLSNSPVVDDRLDAFWVDYGTDNYAGRSFENFPAVDNRRVWLGWMNNWAYASNLPTHPWRGSMTLPRVMEIHETDDGPRLVQTPIGELSNLVESELQYNGGSIVEVNEWINHNNVSGKSYRLMVEFDEFSASAGVHLFKSETQQTSILIDPFNSQLKVDRNSSGVNFFEGLDEIFAPISINGEKISIDIFVDQSALEIFADNGQSVVSLKVFPGRNSNGIEFFGNAKITSVSFYRMESIWNSTRKLLDTQNELEFSIYPNPTYDKVYIPSHIGVLRLTDIAGRKMDPRIIKRNESQELILPQKSGIYILTLVYNRKSFTHKILKKEI